MPRRICILSATSRAMFCASCHTGDGVSPCGCDVSVHQQHLLLLPSHLSAFPCADNPFFVVAAAAEKNLRSPALVMRRTVVAGTHHAPNEATMTLSSGYSSIASFPFFFPPCIQICRECLISFPIFLRIVSEACACCTAYAEACGALLPLLAVTALLFVVSLFTDNETEQLPFGRCALKIWSSLFFPVCAGLPRFLLCMALSCHCCLCFPCMSSTQISPQVRSTPPSRIQTHFSLLPRFFFQWLFVIDVGRFSLAVPSRSLVYRSTPRRCAGVCGGCRRGTHLPLFDGLSCCCTFSCTPHAVFRVASFFLPLSRRPCVVALVPGSCSFRSASLPLSHWRRHFPE